MRVSNRLDYAVRALVELALFEGQGPIAAREIATRRDIPDAFIHQVMATLARAGFIRSTRGPSGGHELIQPASQITVADVAIAVDGEHPATPDLGDPVRRFWNGLQDVNMAFMRSTTLAGLAAQYRDHENSISYSI
ncbi:MAG TPA: Rrf2 family transcriptional regulator [Thermomicrobiales bacterium]|nr:Rrf2 family transcriptional regulator [Thermomicrobiales bacterium]